MDVDEYEPPHVATEPCPNCSTVLWISADGTPITVYHPADRPCSIRNLMIVEL